MIREIVIIKLSALGDVLRTTALLKPLRQKYPDARITWIAAHEALPLLHGNPFIQRIIPCEQAAEAQRSGLSCDLLISMDEDPTACDLASGLRPSRLVGAYRGPDQRLTYTPASAPWFGMGCLNRDPDGGLQHANHLKRENRKTYVQLWMEILELDHASYPVGCEPILVLSPEEREWAAKFLTRSGLGADTPIIGLNPGAGSRWSAKQLPPESAARFIRLLKERIGAPILLFGGADEAQRNRRILELAQGDAVDAGTAHPLRAFAALLGCCRVLVTTDSLALHIGTALRRYIVALFGPTSPTEIELYGRGFHVMPKCSCRCFYERRCRFIVSCLDELDYEWCADRIDEILRGADQLLIASSLPVGLSDRIAA